MSADLLNMSPTERDEKLSDLVESAMRPVHPGEILQRGFLEPLGMSCESLALKIGSSPDRIMRIISGEQKVTALDALQFALFFESSFKFWCDLQENYDRRIANDDA